MTINEITKAVERHKKHHAHRCFYCGKPFGITFRETIDHVWPTFGKNGFVAGRWNRVPACSRCNTRKGHLTVEQFRELMKPSLHNGLFFFEQGSAGSRQKKGGAN